MTAGQIKSARLPVLAKRFFSIAAAQRESGEPHRQPTNPPPFYTAKKARLRMGTSLGS
jgi:hypothetical protein